MKNRDILTVAMAYYEEKKENERCKKDGLYITEVSYPAAVAWKRYLNFKDILAARDVIVQAMDEVKKSYFDDSHSNPTGELDPNSGTEIRRIKDEYLEEFKQRLDDILDQDTDLNIRKIKISEIPDVVLTESDLSTLAFMIEEE